MRHMTLALALVLAAVGGCDGHDDGRARATTRSPGSQPSTASADAGVLPSDVRRFVTLRDECDHLRGEDAVDADRARWIETRAKTTCTGTDAMLLALKRRHAGDPAIMRELAVYEDGIE